MGYEYFSEYIDYLINELNSFKENKMVEDIILNISLIKESEDYSESNIKLIRKMVAHIQLNESINVGTYSQWFKHFR